MSILKEVKKERDRQDKKWGIQNHNPYVWITILGEEFGEVRNACVEWGSNNADIKEYRKELIQVAAVAVAAIECLDRGKE